MIHRCRSVLLPAALSLLAGLPPRDASAAGFALFEQGAKGMGFAGAFTAQASDPSAIFHNAAGLAFLSGTQIYGGATMVSPQFKFTGAAPFPGPAVNEESDISPQVPPALYISHNTLKTHVSRIFRKLAVNTRRDAVDVARQLGIA